MDKLKLGNRTELLIDDYFIESVKDAQFVINHPVRHETVLKFEKPWESRGSTYATVLDDGKQVFMYYRGFPQNRSNGDFSNNQTTCVAVSNDGIDFERINVNKLSYDGISNENNIIWKGMDSHNLAPFYDENPDCSLEEKYKAVAGLMGRPDGKNGLYAYVSRNGVDWKKIDDKPIITDGGFDSLNTVFYDKLEKVYRCYSRYFNDGVRAIESSVSTDFVNWSEQKPNEYIQQYGIKDQLYTNATRPVPGAEHIYVSMPMRFVQERHKITERVSKGVSDCVLMTSRDGVKWDRRFSQPWIYPGLYEHEWTQRNFIVSPGIIDRNNEFSFHVCLNYEWDDGQIVRFSIPRHRFGSIWAPISGGMIETKKFIREGGELTINYNTSANGSLSIAVLDENSKTIDGFGFDECGEIYGNELEHEVRWNGHGLTELNGKTLKLAISLHDANLYALK